MRRLAAWLSTVSLAGAGVVLAHQLAYRAAQPHAHERRALLAHTGHGYFQYWTVAAALAASVLVVALALLLATAVRGAAATRVNAWPFAVLPPLAFALQEHVERIIHNGELPLTAALEPTFVLGLLLQAPFALAAFLAASALLAAARRFAAALAPPPPATPAPAPIRHAPSADVPAPRVLARGYAGRAPPVPAPS